METMTSCLVCKIDNLNRLIVNPLLNGYKCVQSHTQTFNFPMFSQRIRYLNSLICRWVYVKDNLLPALSLSPKIFLFLEWKGTKPLF